MGEVCLVPNLEIIQQRTHFKRTEFEPFLLSLHFYPGDSCYSQKAGGVGGGNNFTQNNFQEKEYNRLYMTTNLLLELKTLIYLISWSYKKQQCLSEIRRKEEIVLRGKHNHGVDIYCILQ